MIQHFPDFGGKIFLSEWLLDIMGTGNQHTVMGNGVSCIAGHEEVFESWANG